ncbi:hypothetical protein [Paraburkholderia sp.]|uniref:hypothetical protein n=1 Tax=Paraburkholderia sp. TaxID=1926495 RepID=UPI0039E3418B
MGWFFDRVAGRSEQQTGIGGAAHVTNVVFDSNGAPFSLDSCGRAYSYSSGLLVSDTATDPTDGAVRVKTYTYVDGQMTAESEWVPQ